MKENDGVKRVLRQRPTRARKRQQLLQLTSVIAIFMINIRFILSNLKKSRPTTLIVSSTFVCEASGNKDCLAKQWARQNSFKNWIEDGSEVLILEDHVDDCQKIPGGVTCQEHQCMQSFLGLPHVRCLIQTGMRQYPKSVVVFTNDDILFKGLNDTINFLVQNVGEFVAIGKRTNVPLLDLIDLDDQDAIREFEQGSNYPSIDLEELATRHYQQSKPFELDYFIFNIDSSTLDEYPDFVLGNWRWDNVMVDYLLLHNITVVDVSKTVTAFHLGKTSIKQDFRKGAAYNDELMWKYFKNTADMISYQGETDPILRFGSMVFAQYQTIWRSETGEIQLNENKDSIFG